jgi:Ser/Thr protein kinase RdoA (MazF antagonist)
MSYAPTTSSIISTDFLAQLVKERYSFKENTTCKIIRIGINHTYLIKNNEEKYILRVYVYNWRSEQEVLAEIELLNLLTVNKISVSYPILDHTENYIQKINAVEGERFAVLFSYAEGKIIKNASKEICYNLGIEMAKMHQITVDKSLSRKNYNAHTLVNWSFQLAQEYFSEPIQELEYIKNANEIITKQFKEANFEQLRKGIVHLDIWSDNIRIKNNTEITLFDFDNCGNGWLFLDIAYTVMLIFREEPNKEVFEEKTNSFYNGYESIATITKEEKKLIPYGGLAIWLHYTGVHIHRFEDFSSLFFNQNFLKAWLQIVDNWMIYNKIAIKNAPK